MLLHPSLKCWSHIGAVPAEYQEALRALRESYDEYKLVHDGILERRSDLEAVAQHSSTPMPAPRGRSVATPNNFLTKVLGNSVAESKYACTGYHVCLCTALNAQPCNTNPGS
jgi:hypothetical protein